MIDLGLEGKRALVAGAGHRPPRPGIGRAAARALAGAGARVACLDIDATRAQAVADELAAEGAETIAIVADVRKAEGASGAVAEVVEAFDGLDVCVDIIGEARWGTVLEFSEVDWAWSFDMNLRQVFLVFQAAARQMAAQGTGGSLAAVASVDGVLSSSYHVAYGAAKAGLVHLVKTFAEELGPQGIRANAVAPGAVFAPTPEQPTVPPGDKTTPLRCPTADDIANGLLFLSSDLARAVSGQTLVVDGAASTKSAWGFGAEVMEFIRAR